MIFALKTDVGRLRSENQDSCDAFEFKDALFAFVADGMGGHSGGSVASKIAKDTISALIKEKYDPTMSDEVLKDLLTSCVGAANMEIYEKALKEPELEGMGTTLVLVALRGTSAIILNIGDSRAYEVESKEAMQITKDHSYVQELVDMGKITLDEAEKHPQKNYITKALGTQSGVRGDVYERAFNGGYILLCSDGLSNKLDNREIHKIIYNEKETLQTRTEKLIAAANDAGGEDNITAVLIKIN